MPMGCQTNNDDDQAGLDTFPTSDFIPEPEADGVEGRSMRQRAREKFKSLPGIAVAAASPARGKPIKASNTMIALCDATESLGEGGMFKNRGG